MNHLSCLRHWLSALLVLLFTTASLSAAESVYQSSGREVLEMLVTRKVDAARANAALGRMAADAVSLCRDYAAKHPEGKALLDLIISKEPEMRTLSAEVLEKRWHDLEGIKGLSLGVDLSDEDQEHFTDPIHALVHALLVATHVTAAASGDETALAAMKEDLEEGLEQYARARAHLAGK